MELKNYRIPGSSKHIEGCWSILQSPDRLHTKLLQMMIKMFPCSFTPLFFGELGEAGHHFPPDAKRPAFT